MRDGWKRVKLGEVATFQRGYDLPHSQMVEGPYQVVGSNGPIGMHSEYTTEPPVLTIGRSGNVGHPRLYLGKCWAHNTTLYVKDFHGSDPRFIYYFLHTLSLDSYGGGSAVPTLNRNHIHSLDVSIPPLPTQRRIAAVLGALDDKIELNRKMNANLEAQAQALFKSWFVDFDPWGGKMPSGWKKGDLEAITSGYYDGRISVRELTIESYFSTENMLANKGGVAVADSLPTTEFVPECVEGSVLVSNIRPYFKKIHRVTTRGGHSQDVLCLSPVRRDLEWYLYLLLRDDAFFDHMMMGAKGTKMPRGDKTQILKYPVFRPPDEYLKKFNAHVEPLCRQVESNTRESRKLAELRDALLPKLMSGELEVA